MIACEHNEDKEFEKSVEWDSLSTYRRKTISFESLLPEGALPYVHAVGSSDELEELLTTLEDCMNGLDYRRLMPKVRRFFPAAWFRDVDFCEAPTLRAIG